MVPPPTFASAAMDRIRRDLGSPLLPLAYPEGSPTHPSYPTGHAAVAGACVTVLKACFREDFPIPGPVQASADGDLLEPWLGEELTLGGEFSKLAGNITYGLDAGGGHYRTEAWRG